MKLDALTYHKSVLKLTCNYY